VPRLGDLERAVMEVLWAAPGPVTAKQILAGLDGGNLAMTTVLTVLSRLERKGVVSRERDGRAHTYQSTASRADHVAELMREVLGSTPDRAAALARFVTVVDAGDAAALRDALDDAGGRRP